MRFGKCFGIGLMMVSLGCSQARAPMLRPRIIVQGEPVGDGFWLAAPYILVVNVLAAEQTGPPLELTFDRKRTLLLFRFSAEVENVIKGELNERQVSFFFYVDPDQRPRYYLNPGQRYIVALREEAGVLRSMADVMQLAIRVHSGRHDQERLPGGGPGPRIAYVLMTPGLDCNLDEFSRHLAPWHLEAYASASYMASLLEQLRAHPDAIVRDRACVTTAQAFWFRPTCLSSCVNSRDADVRELAKKLLSDAADKTGVPKALRENPLSLAALGHEHGIRERLEMYTRDARPEVRRLACGFLKRAFPTNQFPECR